MANKKQEGIGSFEEALLQELRFGGLDKENLTELVKVIAGINKGGLKIERAFTKGIPVPDGVRVSGQVNLSEVGKLLSEIIPKTPRLAGVHIFPKGIPWPEIFRVDIDLGSSNPMPGRF